MQEQLTILAASFCVDEERAIAHCFELTAQLIAIKQKEGGEVYAIIDGTSDACVVGMPEIAL